MVVESTYDQTGTPPFRWAAAMDTSFTPFELEWGPLLLVHDQVIVMEIFHGTCVLGALVSMQHEISEAARVGYVGR